MKIPFTFLLMIVFYCCAGKENEYVGSTPAAHSLRNFLEISLVDSIDFIKWEFNVDGDRYHLHCRYGIGRPSTNGFIDEKAVNFEGSLIKKEKKFELYHGKKVLSLWVINSNLLQVLDDHEEPLAGNGGYSYTLNKINSQPSDQFNYINKKHSVGTSQAFEGRTPCQELSVLLGFNKGPACDKLKWYVILNTDPKTGKPSGYIMNGTGYRKEKMAKGSWEITLGKNGRRIYKLSPETQAPPIYLLEAGENLLLFTDDRGNLLVGNADFSYTLNKL